MQCSNYQDWMMLQLDGELSEHQWEKLNDHMAQCRVCSEEWRQISYTVISLRNLPIAPPPADLKEATMKRLQESQSLSLQSEAGSTAIQPSRQTESDLDKTSFQLVAPSELKGTISSRMTKSQPMWLGLTAACLLVFVMSGWWTLDGLRHDQNLVSIALQMDSAQYGSSAQSDGNASLKATQSGEAVSPEHSESIGIMEAPIDAEAAPPERSSSSADLDNNGISMFRTPEATDLPPQEAEADVRALAPEAGSEAEADTQSKSNSIMMDSAAANKNEVNSQSIEIAQSGSQAQNETQQHADRLSEAVSWPWRLLAAVSAFALGLLSYRKWRVS